MNLELQIIIRFGLAPGDRFTVPKSNLQVIDHHALYLGNDDFGNHYICENVVGHGVKLTRVQDFFNGVTKVTSIVKFSGTNEKRKEAVQKALSKLGQPYHLINYNCEHFVNDVLHNYPKSLQVENAFKTFFGIALGLFVVALIAGD